MSGNETKAVSAPTGQEGVGALKKHKVSLIGMIGLFFCTAAGGAFGIEEMIPASGPGMTLLLLLLLPVIWGIPYCLVEAEMNSVLPTEGGLFSWIKAIHGEFWGFISGTMYGLACYTCTVAYIALAVNYTAFLFDMSTVVEWILKFVYVGIFTIINLMGITEVGHVSTFLTIVVLIGFAAVTVTGLLNWNQNPFEPVFAAGASPLESIGGGIALGIWMYSGYCAITSPYLHFTAYEPISILYLF